MKSILISIRPEWCKKIADGTKTIEIRKTRPKLETPFKCYIYCTKGRGDCLWRWDGIWYDTQFPNERPNRLDGKVIGEFICEEIMEAECGAYAKIPLAKTAMDAFGLVDYADGAIIYGWCISKLEIYSRPKLLSEFGLTRPPQSWCYVEGARNDG